jgi:hypothetical protein
LEPREDLAHRGIGKLFGHGALLTIAARYGKRVLAQVSGRARKLRRAIVASWNKIAAIITTSSAAPSM